MLRGTHSVQDRLLSGAPRCYSVDFAGFFLLFIPLGKRSSSRQSSSSTLLININASSSWHDHDVLGDLLRQSV